MSKWWRSSAAGVVIGALIFAGLFRTPFAIAIGAGVGALGGLIALVVGTWLRHRLGSPKSKIIAIGLVILALSPFLYGLGISVYRLEIQGPRQRAQSREDGKRIVEALHKYERQNGRYPNSLEDLAPELLDSVPTLPNGEAFQYDVGEESFSLVFNVGRMGCHYDNRLRVVTCSD